MRHGVRQSLHRVARTEARAVVVRRVRIDIPVRRVDCGNGRPWYKIGGNLQFNGRRIVEKICNPVNRNTCARTRSRPRRDCNRTAYCNRILAYDRPCDRDSAVRRRNRDDLLVLDNRALDAARVARLGFRIDVVPGIVLVRTDAFWKRYERKKLSKTSSDRWRARRKTEVSVDGIVKKFRARGSCICVGYGTITRIGNIGIAVLERHALRQMPAAQKPPSWHTKTKGFRSPMLWFSFVKPVRAFSWSRVAPNMPTWTMQINCLCINFSLHPDGKATAAVVTEESA